MYEGSLLPSWVAVRCVRHVRAPAPRGLPATRIPSRIVSLSPTATDDLFAVGAGKQVVAVDSLSTYPKHAPVTKLSAFTPNVEAIAKYRPDLVVISGDENHIVDQLAKLHVPVLLEPAAANLARVYAEIRQLGKATGHTAQAKTVVAGMKKKVARSCAPFRVRRRRSPCTTSSTRRTTR